MPQTLEEKRAYRREYMREWNARQPPGYRSGHSQSRAPSTPETRLRALAWTRIQRAVNRGQIIRPEVCDECGGKGKTGKIHAHHHDYSRPFDVAWLCSACHGRRHRMEEAG